MFSCKSFVAVAILLACGTIAVSARDCPKACTLEFNQVCATNGKEYRLFDNPCMMDAFNCEHEFSWTRTKSLDACLPAEESEINKKSCYTPCTLEYNPVCGSNGQRYQIFGNLCDMNNAHCDDGKVWSVSNFANCDETVPQQSNMVSQEVSDCVRPCGVEYAPICAFNGERYELFDNVCDMHNAECLTHGHFKPAPFVACVFLPKAVEAPVNCEKPCTFEYNPVCGSNGLKHEVFSNTCELQNAHCKDGKTWTQTRFTECLEFASVETPKHNCVKPCNKMYAPVCGTDGQTYKVFGNQCAMENEHCYDNHQWHATNFGLCENPIPLAAVPKKDCIKVCPLIYAPVCGTDGQTYKVFDNQCLLDSEIECDGHHWHATNFALCENPIPLAVAPKTECVKPCNRMYSPVCGTDGQTYKVFSNQCVMENEHCYDNHQWHSTNFGLCENPIPLAAAPKKTECVKPCNRMYAPVCGTDGQTYKVFSNQCVMENEHCYDNHQWHSTNFGLCENPIPLAVAPKKDCIKICPRIYAPVCGTDGQTYQVFDNQCLMEKEFECDGHHWHATNFGLCENPIPLAETPYICPANYDPQCGLHDSEYKVFGNQCMMDAYNSMHQYAQFVHLDLSFCQHLL